VAGPLVPVQMEAGTKGSRPKARFPLVKVVFKLMLKAYETNPDEFEWHHSKAIHRSKILEVDFYKNITKFLQSN
jgi:hypothetical protein